MIEETFVCYDENELHAYVFETPNAKGVVQFLHGIQEYCKPYFSFAEFLNKKGYNVYMVDARGHGKSCKKLSQIGKADGDVFSASICDELCITNMLHARYNLPLYLIGFSYGSFLLQACLPRLKHASKVILIGSGYMRTPKVYFAKFICKCSTKFKGANTFAKNLEHKLLKYYNRKCKAGTWITSNDSQLATLTGDKLCRVPFSYGFYESMFDNLPYITSRINKIDKDLPILLLSGSEDPVGDYGKGIQKLFNKYKNNQLNAKLIIYPNARHNLLFEKNQSDVYTDIVNFLAKK